MIVQNMPYPTAGGGSGALAYVGGTVYAIDSDGSGNEVVPINSLTGGLASSPSSGDIVVIFYGWLGTSDQDLVVATSGYTEVADLYSNDDLDANAALAYKVLSSSETEVQIAPSQNGAFGFAAAVHVWRGIDPTTPLDVSAQTATGQNTGRANPPAITPSSPNAIIIAAGLGGYTSGVAFTSSDLDNFISDVSLDSFKPVVGMGSKAWEGGAFDPAQFGGGSTSTSASWVAATIALRPA